MAADNSSTIPPYSRICRAASCEEPWTADETIRRDMTPLWLISEAQAHVSRALDRDEHDARFGELSLALQLVSKLPTKQLRDDVAKLFLLGLSESDQAEFQKLCDKSMRNGAQSENRISSEFPIGLAAQTSIDTPSQITAALAEPKNRPSPKATRPDARRAVWGRRQWLQTAAGLSGFGILTYLLSKGGQWPQQTNITFTDKRSLDDDLRSTDRTIYGNEKFPFEVVIKSPLRRAWLIHMDGDPEYIPYEEGPRQDGEIRFEMTFPARAKDRFEYFIVVAADGDVLPDTSEPPAWLFELQSELMELNPAEERDTAKAEAIVRRHIAKSKYSGEAAVRVEGYVRRKEARN